MPRTSVDRSADSASHSVFVIVGVETSRRVRPTFFVQLASSLNSSRLTLIVAFFDSLVDDRAIEFLTGLIRKTGKDGLN